MKNKSSRRDFLRISATGAVSAFLLTKTASVAGNMLMKPKKSDLALQLFTIRDAMNVDVPGSLKKVSDIGYKYLELAGYNNRRFYGMVPADFKKLVQDLGMEILSSHTQVEAKGITMENARTMAEDHAALGAKYCIQPWVNAEDRNSIAGYQKMVGDWNQVGKIMKEFGIQFGYHNHNFEFATVEGKIPFYDVFLPEMDKDLITMELDLFWITKAGQNPIEIIQKYPGRFQLFHMKDMYNKDTQPAYSTDHVSDFAPVGEGIINFKEILKFKDTAGLKYLVVEQDSTRNGKPFKAIQTSLRNLTTDILL